MSGPVPVWLVDRSFSNDEQNLIIAKYATADGTHTFRKELAVPSLGTNTFDIPECVEASEENLTYVEDEETRAWYRRAVNEQRTTEGC